MKQLFSFVRADLQSYQPRERPVQRDGFGTPFDDAGTPSGELHFPKSLFLLQPLFTAYELNPVATAAQMSVPVPEGLDIESWIVAPPREERTGPAVELSLGEKKVKKIKKGKEKAGNGGKVKPTKNKAKQEDGSIESEETAEDKEARNRVRSGANLH
jgi:AP-3 complex subunit delta-1